MYIYIYIYRRSKWKLCYVHINISYTECGDTWYRPTYNYITDRSAL